MSEKLLVPDIGDFEEVEIIEVLVKQGDQLNINDPVITIESDKSSVEIPQQKLERLKRSKLKLEIKFQKEILS
jgi:pyruvate dehydrogenase E1 component